MVNMSPNALRPPPGVGPRSGGGRRLRVGTLRQPGFPSGQNRRHAKHDEPRSRGIAVEPDGLGRHSGRLEEADDTHHTGRRYEQRKPVGHDIAAHPGGLLVGAQALHPEGVDHDVLGGRDRGDEHRGKGDQQRRSQRIEPAEHDDRRDQQQLGEYEPAPAPAQKPAEHRDAPGIDKGSPQELQRVGKPGQRIEPDRRQVDADVGHPQHQRRGGQRQRQPGREAEQRHDEHLPLEIDRDRRGQPLQRLGQSA
jgi:hypothetical protein